MINTLHSLIRASLRIVQLAEPTNQRRICFSTSCSAGSNAANGFAVSPDGKIRSPGEVDYCRTEVEQLS